MAEKDDLVLLTEDTEAIVTFVTVATSSSKLLTDADAAEFERIETTIVESRRRAENAAASLKLC